MHIHVELEPGDHEIAMPRRVHLEGRRIDVVETLDRWYGRDYCYIKVKSREGSVYILRLDETHAEWELTMFQRARPRWGPGPSV
jgi:hypothetical protein